MRRDRDRPPILLPSEMIQGPRRRRPHAAGQNVSPALRHAFNEAFRARRAGDVAREADDQVVAHSSSFQKVFRGRRRCPFLQAVLRMDMLVELLERSASARFHREGDATENGDGRIFMRSMDEERHFRDSRARMCFSASACLSFRASKMICRARDTRRSISPESVTKRSVRAIG